jgi:hypothetical protein
MAGVADRDPSQPCPEQEIPKTSTQSRNNVVVALYPRWKHRGYNDGRKSLHFLPPSLVQQEHVKQPPDQEIGSGIFLMALTKGGHSIPEVNDRF